MASPGHALLKVTPYLAQRQCGAAWRNDALKGKADLELMLENSRKWLKHCDRYG